MPEKNREGAPSLITVMLKGMVLCFALLIVVSILLGFLSSLDAIQEELANKLLLITNYVAIFGGGIYTAWKVDSRGWFNGGVVGLFYMVVVVIIGSQVIEVSFGFEMILRVLSGFITGAIGGVIGVNIK